MVEESKYGEGFVLIVDDEEAIREALGELLEACGFTVRTADCYETAVHEFKSNPDIEAVLCDLKMPGKSGVEVLKYVNIAGLGIPLIFLTGFGTLESAQEAVREGAFDYILKPVDNKDKVLFPLKHAIERTRMIKVNKEMQKDIIQMAEEHQKILEDLLEDVETKGIVQEKIEKILNKWGD